MCVAEHIKTNMTLNKVCAEDAPRNMTCSLLRPRRTLCHLTPWCQPRPTSPSRFLQHPKSGSDITQPTLVELGFGTTGPGRSSLLTTPPASDGNVFSTRRDATGGGRSRQAATFMKTRLTISTTPAPRDVARRVSHQTSRRRLLGVRLFSMNSFFA